MNKIATRTAVVMSVVCGAMLAFAGAASASTSPLDGVTTEVNTAKGQLSTFITGTGVPVVFGLLILGVGIALAAKFLRRAARSA